MKNIHVLPTCKPSRLCKNDLTNSLGFVEIPFPNGGFVSNQNIYVTCDEEIKEGDWFLSLISEKPQIEKEDASFLDKDLYKKIILTTDQDLIKDGVQSIDDEFLEWFIKNPSCERIEVNGISDVALGGFADVCYKIIIPKEEPKNICIQTGLPCGMQCLSEETCNSIRLKQETLEEASREYYKRGQLGFEKAADTEMAFFRGGKWQQERMYSEEDLEVAYFEGREGLYSFNDWLKLFKNK